MFGMTEIYTALNVSAVTTLLDAYGSGKALFSDSLVPEDFTGYKSINFYLESPTNGGINYGDYNYSVNCRAATYAESIAIANAVYTALNRAHGSDSFTVCSVLRTIPPEDSTDVYNTPVSIKLLTRSN